MSIREQYSKQIEREVNKFRKELKRVEQSENPYYHDPKVLEYETKQLREALEKPLRRSMRNSTQKLTHRSSK